jgi:DNA-binding CsgD family transcriptional regulator
MAGEVTPALSERQKQVLSLIDRRLTIKEIAAELGISETRVNQHITTLKQRLDANTHRELAARYREMFTPVVPPPFRNPAGTKTQLVGERQPRSIPGRAADGDLVLADVHAFSLEAPWARASEPQVVPPVLDGKNAVLLRLAVVAAMVCGILASLILAITAATSLTEVVGGRPDISQTG